MSSTIEVKSVDGYQGRERDVIFFSAVRSNCQEKVGFLTDSWRCMNVALTRARSALVGGGDLLRSSLTVSSCIRLVNDTFSRSKRRRSASDSSNIIIGMRELLVLETPELVVGTKELSSTVFLSLCVSQELSFSDKREPLAQTPSQPLVTSYAPG
jgi:AAA domain